METKILTKIEAETNPNLDEGWNFCLVTPVGEDFELTYFNADENNLIMLKQSVGNIKVNKNSILFCLTPKSELVAPNLGCQAAIKRQ